jgi:hypothetical protein
MICGELNVALGAAAGLVLAFARAFVEVSKERLGPDGAPARPAGRAR